MAGRPLRPATDRRFGGPLPRQLPNQTRAHPISPEFFTPSHAALCAYAVLAAVSSCYPPVWGRSPTRYSPVRRSVSQESIRRNQLIFFAHAASLHQAFAHCAIFPTAASRRSLGRVSVPMWPVTLSGRLWIVALVGRYLTN